MPTDIASILGPPGKGDSEGPVDAMDNSEGTEGGELRTHLKAFQKAMTTGQMGAAEDAFRAAVTACSSGEYPTQE